MRPLPIALLAMGVALLESCNTMCTLIGCADVVEMCAPIVTTAHLRVCRESECSDVTYGPSETYVENDLGPIVRFQGCISVDLPSDPRDGDVYTVTGWDADGNEVDYYEWTATYELFYPNGERCGPECHRVTLTDTTP